MSWGSGDVPRASCSALAAGHAGKSMPKQTHQHLAHSSRVRKLPSDYGRNRCAHAPGKPVQKRKRNVGRRFSQSEDKSPRLRLKSQKPNYLNSIQRLIGLPAWRLVPECRWEGRGCRGFPGRGT